MNFYIFSHTPFHHLQLCQILANSECDIIEDKILGLGNLPYGKFLIESTEDLYEVLEGLPGISVQDADKEIEDI